MCKKKLSLRIPDSDRTIAIDLLTNQEDGIILIPTGTKFALPNKRGLFGQRRFNKGAYIAKIRPKHCEIEFSRNPLLCSFLHSELAYDCSFTVNGECELPYSIALDKKAFLNFKEVVLSEDKTFELPFTIEIFNAKGEKMHDEVLEEKLLIRAKAFRSEVKFSYTPEKRKITYHAPTPNPEDSLHKVGVLHVEHNGNVPCVPPMQSFSITLETSRMGCDGHLACFCTKPTNDSNYRSTNRNIQIFHLVSGQCIDIPIYWNMVEINNNPLEATQYDFLINYNSNSRKEGEILLNRDTSVTEPDVRIQIGKKAKHLYGAAKMGEPTWLENPIYMYYDTANQIKYDGDIVFENLAKASNKNESIAVWDITTEVSFAHPQDESRLKLCTGKTLQHVVDVDACKDFLHLKPLESKTIHFNIHAKEIYAIEAAKDMSVTEVEICLSLSYRLFVDKEGEHALELERGRVPALDILCPQKYSNIIYIKLQKQPNPECMCVDFGTSAIVAGLSDANRNIKYLDLKKIKDSLLLAAYPGDDSSKRRNDDEDRPFISSSICLNPQYFMESGKRDFRYVTNKETDERTAASEYKLYPIWFSPGVGVINLEYQIPCLKMIVGYNHIPDIFRPDSIKNILRWTYRDETARCQENKEGLVNLLTEGFGGTLNYSELLHIENLFRQVYRQLFIHYLKINRISANKIVSRQINQLVLTVPNTYTPYNIDTIRNIARETMPSIYPECLTMVSESDAVACYYLLKRQTFFKSAVMNESRREQLMQKENVLVYDMGAGTLDLTLFTIECPNNTEHTIDIKKKMGVNIAGNYLDYTIAEILLDLCSHSSFANAGVLSQKLKDVLLVDKSEAVQKNVTSNERNMIKDFVKRIKTHLNDLDYIIPALEIGNNKVELGKSSKDIINHKLFKRFIESITKRVFTNFFASSEETIQIDTVIFSGRSTELNQIRLKVKESLSQILPDSENILYANICDNKFYTDIQFESTGTSEQLKKVVTEGALAFADRFNRANGKYSFKTRANYATFGIVVRDIENHYTWYPLIERGEVWNETGEISTDVITFNTSDILQMEFIQTYSHDVVKDFESQRYDMISRLLPINIEATHVGSLEIKLSYYNLAIRKEMDSALTLWINNNPAPIHPHEDFNDVELRKSLWPVIF